MATSEKQSKSAKNKSGNNSGQTGSQTDIGSTATEAVGQVQETVTGLKDQVKETASNQLTSRLESVTGSLDMAARVLRTAGDTVREQDKTGVADSITGVADRIEGWSTSLREQDVDKLIDETKQMAQKQPVLFVSGAVALGFLGARFLTSSAKKQEETSSSGGDDSASSGSASTSTSSSPAAVDMPDLPTSSALADSELDNTNPYPSVEENAAIEASMEAPFGSEETMVFEDEIIVPEFGDSTRGTTGSKTSTGDR